MAIIDHDYIEKMSQNYEKVKPPTLITPDQLKDINDSLK